VPKISEPTFTISLAKGLADRHRMPVTQVMAVIDQVRQMLIETGREIYRERGGEPSNLDFGLEIVANSGGSVFTSGSLNAKIAVTSNIEIGIEAAMRVLDTVRELNKNGDSTGHPAAFIEETTRRQIVSRLDRMTFLQETSKSEARFRVMVPKAYKTALRRKAPTTAIFGDAAINRLKTFRQPLFVEHGVTLHGKLIELKDKSQVESVELGKFWGELRRDNGERWRIQFDSKDEEKAVPLFRRQVRVLGTAHYYQSRTPKLTDVEVFPDENRDYVAAFKELFGIHKDLYRSDLKGLLDGR